MKKNNVTCETCTMLYKRRCQCVNSNNFTHLIPFFKKACIHYTEDVDKVKNKHATMNM